MACCSFLRLATMNVPKLIALTVIAWSLPAGAQSEERVIYRDGLTYNEWAIKANERIMRDAKPGTLSFVFPVDETPEQKRANEKRRREESARREAAQKVADAAAERERQAFQEKKSAANEQFSRQLRENFAKQGGSDRLVQKTNYNLGSVSSRFTKEEAIQNLRDQTRVYNHETGKWDNIDLKNITVTEKNIGGKIHYFAHSRITPESDAPVKSSKQ
jgi:hypothetical protein